MKEAIKHGHFVWKETEGQAMIDAYQKSLPVEEEPVPENPRYPLPNIDIPEDIRVSSTKSRW